MVDVVFPANSANGCPAPEAPAAEEPLTDLSARMDCWYEA